MTRQASEWEQQKTREFSRAILEGRLTIIEGARALCPFAHTDAIPNDDDRLTIIGIESETDHLPVGEVRKYWLAESLREKDIEIARCEAFYRRRILDVCRRILDQGEGAV